MPSRQTELTHGRARALDLKSDAEIVSLLADGQAEAAACVAGAGPALSAAAHLMARTISAGGRLIYAAAGSSGLMALADALELPGTYGISRSQIEVVLAGGMAALKDMKGGPEDDADAARSAISELAPKPSDCLIAVTASGETPFPLAAAETARFHGAATIGIANNADASLFGYVDVSVCLQTPAEVIAGSTRMGAGTAQKIALNTVSTLMAIRLGHVHDGYMVNLIADNGKLRERARNIVQAISGVDASSAETAIEVSGGQVKLAVLIASGNLDRTKAEHLLNGHNGRLRPALAELGRAGA